VLGSDNRILETKTMGRFTYVRGGGVIPDQQSAAFGKWMRDWLDPLVF
jgi:hypothetical protein